MRHIDMSDCNSPTSKVIGVPSALAGFRKMCFSIVLQHCHIRDQPDGVLKKDNLERFLRDIITELAVREDKTSVSLTVNFTTHATVCPSIGRWRDSFNPRL